MNTKKLDITCIILTISCKALVNVLNILKHICDDIVCSGVATIEATEAAALVKNVQQFRLSRPEFWHPEFFTTIQHYQELIIVEGECLTLHRPVKNDPEKFKGILSVKLCNL